MMMMLLSKFAATGRNKSSRSSAILMQSSTRTLSIVVGGVARSPFFDRLSLSADVSLSSSITTTTRTSCRRLDFVGNVGNNQQWSSNNSSRRLLSFYQQPPGGGYGSGSSSSGGGGGQLRAFPQYAVFGETCLLSN
jgi:hypothetical protein